MSSFLPQLKVRIVVELGNVFGGRDGYRSRLLLTTLPVPGFLRRPNPENELFSITDPDVPQSQGDHGLSLRLLWDILWLPRDRVIFWLGRVSEEGPTRAPGLCTSLCHWWRPSCWLIGYYHHTCVPWAAPQQWCLQLEPRTHPTNQPLESVFKHFLKVLTTDIPDMREHIYWRYNHSLWHFSLTF